MQVDIVKFPGGSVSEPNNFIEVPPIKGAVPTIIRRTMEKLQDMVIEEMVTKVDYQMEAIRRFSYPYQSLEEAVVNAFYHRDYMSHEPVHIEIEPDCINIISFPGPDRSISMETIKKGERFTTRIYRNRRLGEFLKELELAEGHSTGIPTIQDELAVNGSPKATFYTDVDRRAMRVQIPIHPDFIKIGADKHTVKKENVIENVIDKNYRGKVKVRMIAVLRLIESDNAITTEELSRTLNVTTRTIARDLDHLKKSGVLERDGTDVSGKWKMRDVER